MSAVAENTQGPRAVNRNAREEWEIYDSLHPAVREILRDSPFDFSAIDALRVWNDCQEYLAQDWFVPYSESRHIQMFREQMRLNVAHLTRLGRSDYS